MSVSADSITEVSLKSCPEYLPRIRTIVACLADSVGMDAREISDTTLALTEACANAIRHGSPRGADDSVVVTLKSSPNMLTADVTDCGDASELVLTSGVDAKGRGMGLRLMRMLSDSVQFIGHKTGLTVRLTKRAKRCAKTPRFRVRRPSAVGRN